ncbi:hypothetical protein HDU84_007444 [Entophlyctis sp. JEL0112]|nr:hypothetical protein HDU84_007444 [Entophlyctis sp. JEL0112]
MELFDAGYHAVVLLAASPFIAVTRLSCYVFNWESNAKKATAAFQSVALPKGQAQLSLVPIAAGWPMPRRPKPAEPKRRRRSRRRGTMAAVHWLFGFIDFMHWLIVLCGAAVIVWVWEYAERVTGWTLGAAAESSGLDDDAASMDDDCARDRNQEKEPSNENVR